MLSLGWERLGSAPLQCCSQILHSQVMLRLHPWLCPWRGGTRGFVQSEQPGGAGAAVVCR